MDVITIPENLKTTSGLTILLHGVISLTAATSYDKHFFLYEPCHDISKQCGMLTWIDSDESVQSHFTLRNSKCFSVSSLRVIKYSSD